MEEQVIDWAGSLLGRLKVLRRAPDHFRCGCHMWRCKCECGEVVNIYESELEAGSRTSCGCQGQILRPVHYPSL